jgi:hypothetical protein
VLWVTISSNSDSAHNISAADTAGAAYTGQTTGGSTALGGPQIFTGAHSRYGIGVEYAGQVQPANFVPGNWGLLGIDIGRDSAIRDYEGDGTVPISGASRDFSATIPYGNEGNAAATKDIDPQAGGAGSGIFQWDDPGVTNAGDAVGSIRRKRMDAREFAIMLVPNAADGGFDRVVCSNVYTWYVALSMVNVAPGGAGNWTTINDLTTDPVISDNTWGPGSLESADGLDWDLGDDE